MIMRTLALVMFSFCTFISGCDSSSTDEAEAEFRPSASAQSTGCPRKFEDSDWVNMGSKPLEDHVRAAAMASNSNELVAKIGAPDLIELIDGAKKQVWIYGTTRKSTVTECDESVRDIYTTEYRLLEVSSNPLDSTVTGCRVAFRVYQSEQPSPDPSDSADLLDFYSEDEDCHAWLELTELTRKTTPERDDDAL